MSPENEALRRALAQLKEWLREEQLLARGRAVRLVITAKSFTDPVAKMQARTRALGFVARVNKLQCDIETLERELVIEGE